MNILFVCKYNRFRSKIAEAYFKKINKNESIVVRSAGLVPDFAIDEEIFKVVDEFGLKISPKPEGVNYDLVRWADNIPASIFDEIISGDRKKVVHWEIEDCDPWDKQGRGKTIKLICDKVDELVSSISQ